MTGYTVHTGSTVKFSGGWDRIFSGKQPSGGPAKLLKKSAKKSTSKAAAGKRPPGKKPAKKPGRRRSR